MTPLPFVRTLVLACLVLYGSAIATAQQTVTLDPNIESVVTFGEWKAGGQEGQWRLVLVTRGFDHLLSTLYVQWIAAPTRSDDSAKIVKTMQVPELPTVCRLVPPTTSFVRKQWQATIEGVNTHTATGKETLDSCGKWIITLGPPGEVTVRAVK